MKFCRTASATYVLALSFLLLAAACDSSPIDGLAISSDYSRQPAEYIPEIEQSLRRSTISAIDYNLNLDLTQANRYTGTVDIRFDYQPTTYPVTIDFAGGEVERLLLNNSPIGIDYDGEFISIPARLLRPAKNRVKIQFSKPFSHESKGLNRYFDPIDKGIYLSHQSGIQSNHHFFPMFDQPDMPFSIKAMLSTNDDWTLYSSIPTTQVESRGDFKLWHLEADLLNPDSLALVAGTWHEWQGKNANKEVRVLVRKSMKDHIPVRGWYQRIQSSTVPLASYFKLGTEQTQLTIVLLPGVYQQQSSAQNLMALSEHPNLINLDLNPDWPRLLTQHYVAVNLQQKPYQERWLEIWLTEQVLQRLFPDHDNRRPNPSFKDRIQPGQKILASSYPAIMDNLHNNYSLNVKSPAAMDGIHLISHAESLALAIRNYLTTPAASFSDLLDGIQTVASLSPVTWATQALASPGLTQIHTERHCEQGQMTRLHIQQKALPHYPLTRHMQLTLRYQNERDIISKPLTMTAENFIYDEFDGVDCNAVILLSAEPAVDIRNHNQSARLREFSLLHPDYSILELFITASRSLSELSSDELIQWLHLVRVRLDTLTQSETEQIIHMLNHHVAKTEHGSEELGTAYRRLSNRLYQLSLQAEAHPDRRIQWFKLHLITVTDASEANRLFNWFIGKSEPRDLLEIESLQIAVLNRLSQINHQYTDLLQDSYREQENTLFTPYLRVLETIYANEFDAIGYLETLLENQTRHSADFSIVLFHQDFFKSNDSRQLLAYVVANIDRLEQRLGSRLLQLWLEPTLNDQCSENSLLDAISTAAQNEQLARISRVWLSEISRSCQAQNFYKLY